MTFHEALAMGQNYTWGPIVRSYSIGSYSILEYTPQVFEQNAGTGRYEGVAFHVFVNDEDTNHSFTTLDQALAGAIAYRIDGPNSQAALYFIRGLGGAR